MSGPSEEPEDDVTKSGDRRPSDPVAVEHPDIDDVDTESEVPELPKMLVFDAATNRWVRRLAFVLAAAAGGFLWLDDRNGWLEYQPGGTAFFTYVRPASYVLLAIGALVAIRWAIVGGIIGGFAAGAVGAFAVNQLVGRHAVLVVSLLAIPAALWVLVDLNSWGRRQAILGLTVAAMFTAGGAAAGEAVYEYTFGPKHPESDRAALPESPVRWVWAGGVTSSSGEVRARTHDADVPVKLAVGADADLSDAGLIEPYDRDRGIAMFRLADLAPDTTYHYAVEVAGELDLVRTGTFRTFPDGATSFRFTVGACARTGSNGSVFDRINADDPLFHLITGDFHYGDIPDDDRERYDDVIDLTLRQPAQAALYQSTPIAYVWDDHDYGVNNSSSLSSSRAAAMDAYRANVPSYELAGPDSAVYQRFDVGRVRFLLTDSRSARVPGESMLGRQQLDWLLAELADAAAEAAFVVWVNPVPWVAEREDGADHWGGYPEERRTIADAIAELDLADRLLMISGDAHMVAMDDGSNTDYSSEGGAGFPLVHSAPLDRPPSAKGGPYSEGIVTEAGQYVRIDVTDDGGAITVEMNARDYTGETVMSHTFEVSSP